MRSTGFRVQGSGSGGVRQKCGIEGESDRGFRIAQTDLENSLGGLPSLHNYTRLRSAQRIISGRTERYSEPQSGLDTFNRRIACGKVFPCTLNPVPFYPLL